MPSKPYKALKPMFQKNKWRLVTGDLVQIIAGKDKGLQGKILAVMRDKRFPRVLVENCNLVKKHVKSTGDEPGFIVSMEAPLHYSNVALVDPVTGKPVRTQIQYTEEGAKVRVSKGRNASGSIVPKPSRARTFDPDTVQVGPKDTVAGEAVSVTYDPASPFPFAAQLQHKRKLSTSPFSSAAQLHHTRKLSSSSVPSHSVSLEDALLARARESRRSWLQRHVGVAAGGMFQQGGAARLAGGQAGGWHWFELLR